MTDHIRTGRRSPHTILDEWMAVAKVSVGAKALYWVLKAHVNGNRPDSNVWPTQDTLAEILQKSQATINRYIGELVDLQAIDRLPERTADGGCIYAIHDTPPDGYTGYRSLAELYAARRARRATLTLVTPTVGAAPTDAPLPTPAPVAPLTVAHDGPTPTPEQRAHAEKIVAECGHEMTGRAQATTVEAVAEALARGWPELVVLTGLRGFNVGARFPHRVAVRRMRDLGTPPPAVVARPGRCAKRAHELQPAEGCRLCAGESLGRPDRW